MKSVEAIITELLGKRLLFTPHSVDQMQSPERLITLAEVKEALRSGKIIEDYPEDKRGHSCLVSGSTLQDRPLHIVCSPKKDYLAIITVYVPDNKNWDSTFTKRKR